MLCRTCGSFGSHWFPSMSCSAGAIRTALSLNEASLLHFLYSALMWHGVVVQLLYRPNPGFHALSYCLLLWDPFTQSSWTLENEMSNGMIRSMSVESNALIFLFLFPTNMFTCVLLHLVSFITSNKTDFAHQSLCLCVLFLFTGFWMHLSVFFLLCIHTWCWYMCVSWMCFGWLL